MLINGQVALPFNIKTYPPTKPDRDRGADIKEYYLLKEGRERETVEREIETRRRSMGVPVPNIEKWISQSAFYF